MADTVMIEWTDDTGTYTNSFSIENPTLEDVKKATPFMPTVGTPPPDQFYANLSQQMINQVLAMAQQAKQQQVMQAIPPISAVPMEKS